MAVSKFINLEKNRRAKLFGILAVVAIATILLAVFLVKAPNKPNASIQVPKAKTESITGQAGGEGSAEYNLKLQKHDDAKAAEALKGGQSFVPTPVGNKKPTVGKKENTTPPAPKVAQVKTAPTRKPQPDNTLLKRMLEDLAALDAKLSSVSANTGKIVYEKDFSKDIQTAEATKEVPVAKAEAVAFQPDLKPGDLLYAVIDTGVNSDVPSAVMATIAQGKYRDARLLGGFQRHDERMILVFNRAVLPSGQSFQLEAYAVDPQTSEASVASSVDTHFFSRWGGLIASAFLEGLGSAKRYSGASSTVYGNGNNASDQMVWNNYSPQDQAWIAAGKVGEKASKIFEKNFDRPPTVHLESGTTVGILILNVKGK